MNAISERDFHLLADAVRRRQRATADSEIADALDQHAFRALGYVDDLAEGESVNGMDYKIVRAAVILHDVAATKVRSTVAAEASALLGAEMLSSIGADEGFASAVETAIRRHPSTALDGDDDGETERPQGCAEMLAHDACLLARIETMCQELLDVHASMPRLHAATASLWTGTARRIATDLVGSLTRQPTPAATA